MKLMLNIAKLAEQNKRRMSIMGVASWHTSTGTESLRAGEWEETGEAPNAYCS